MKKKILLITVTVITILCIIIGTTVHYSNIKKSVNYVFNNENDSDWDNSSENSYTLQSFDKINIDANIMKINIKEGENFNLKASFTKDYLKPKAEVVNNTLIIEQHSVKKSISGQNNCTITITVPKETNLTDVEIESNISEVEIENLKIKDIDIENNIGEISIDNVMFSELKAESNIGEISIELPDNLNEYNIKAESNIGSVNINEEEFKKSYNQKGSSSKKIQIETNIGEIKIR